MGGLRGASWGLSDLVLNMPVGLGGSVDCVNLAEFWAMRPVCMVLRYTQDRGSVKFGWLLDRSDDLTPAMLQRIADWH